MRRDSADGESPSILTERQEQLLRRMQIVVWAMLALGLIALAFWIANQDAVATAVAVALVAAFAAIILLGRSLARTGPPFEGARWWWPF